MTKPVVGSSREALNANTEEELRERFLENRHKGVFTWSGGMRFK